MKKFFNIIIASFFTLLVFGIAGAPKAFAATGTIDPDSAGYQYAKFVDTGFQINFKPTNGRAVLVEDDKVTGEAWSSGFGWINLGPFNNNQNAGISNDGQGNLSGFAWDQTGGWINFGPFNNNSADPVSIDLDTGFFQGNAWSENGGWIVFDCDDPDACVHTDWRPDSDLPQCSDGIDNDGDGLIDYPDDPGCSSPDDDSEANSLFCILFPNHSSCTSGGGGGGGNPPTVPACSDGIDNDGDELIDYPDDPGCESEDDDDERIPVGCGDPEASNFNINHIGQIIVHDPSECTYDEIPGCKISPLEDPSIINYSDHPYVVHDDSTCLRKGCTIESADNYEPWAVQNDNSCIFSGDNDPPIPPGFTEACFLIEQPDAINGRTDTEGYVHRDSECRFKEPKAGCMIPGSENYDPDATVQLPYSCIAKLADPGDQIRVTQDRTKNRFNNSYDAILLSALATIGLLLGSSGPITNAVATPMRTINSIPTLFGFRRRKRPWGVVYDSITKQPLDPVYVELRNQSGEVVATSITDLDGRYGFLVPAGVYTISAQKSDYLFPSDKMRGKTKDTIYENLYFGEQIVLKEDDELIIKNIPLDSLNFNWNEFEKSKNKNLMKFFSKTELWLSKIASFAFAFGFAFSIFALYYSPNTFNTVIFVLYVLIGILSLVGIKPRKPGFVVRKETGEPLSFGIIRIFSASLGREVAHTVIGKTGKYFSLVPNGEYFIKIEEKIGENQYREVLTSEAFEVKKGYVNSVVKI